MPRKGTPKVSVPAFKLANATCDHIAWPHELYAELPADNDDPGPMPCLAVGTAQNGVQTWQGLIVALPRDANRTCVDLPEISAALAIIKSIQRVNIRSMKGLDFIDELDERSYRERPFSHFDPEAHKAFEQVVDELRDARIIGPCIYEQLNRSWENLTITAPTGSPWSPVVLTRDVKILGKHTENWELLRHWQGWLSETKDIKKLHHNHRKMVRSNPRISNCQKRSIPPSTKYDMLLKAFLKRLETLGIPHSQRVLDPDAAEKDKLRRKAVRLKSEERRQKYAESKELPPAADQSEDAKRNARLKGDEYFKRMLNKQRHWSH